MSELLGGTVRRWTFNGNTRLFGEVCLSFDRARKLTMATRYNALTNKGEQRDIKDGHIRTILRAMSQGDYTPAALTVGVTPQLAKKLVITNDTWSLEVSEENPLALTDGGHRVETLTRIEKQLLEAISKEKDASKRAKLEASLAEVRQLPIHFTILLNGDTRQDFINLQKGASVDKAHMLSLAINTKQLDDCFETAFKTARALHEQKDGPFHRYIRFDSRGGSLPVPITTLCAKGGSDASFSLVGLARLANGRTPDQLASVVKAVYDHIDEAAPQLTYENKYLRPVSDNAPLGCATLLVGLAVLALQRMNELGVNEATEEVLEPLSAAARRCMGGDVDGNLTTATKRQLLMRTAAVYWQDVDTPKHELLPLVLLKVLSPSAYGIRKKLPKTAAEQRAGKRGRPIESPAVEATDELVELANKAREARERGDLDQAYELGEKVRQLMGGEPEQEEEGDLVAVGADSDPWEDEVQG